jgi:hypothetical protein
MVARSWGLLLLALAGCVTTIVPPAAPADPVTVALADYGYHSSLILPGPEGGSVEYAYGQWGFFALNEDAWYHAIAAVLWPAQGTLGRRRFDVEPAAAVERVRCEGRLRFQVGRAEAEALARKLDERYRRHLGSEVFNPVTELTHVPDDESYCGCNNCNHVLAGWLEGLGCEVRGGACFSVFELAPRLPGGPFERVALEREGSAVDQDPGHRAGRIGGVGRLPGAREAAASAVGAVSAGDLAAVAEDLPGRGDAAAVADEGEAHARVAREGAAHGDLAVGAVNHAPEGDVEVQGDARLLAGPDGDVGAFAGGPEVPFDALVVAPDDDVAADLVVAGGDGAAGLGVVLLPDEAHALPEGFSAGDEDDVTFLDVCRDPAGLAGRRGAGELGGFLGGEEGDEVPARLLRPTVARVADSGGAADRLDPEPVGAEGGVGGRVALGAAGEGVASGLEVLLRLCGGRGEEEGGREGDVSHLMEYNAGRPGFVARRPVC